MHVDVAKSFNEISNVEKGGLLTGVEKGGLL
jgi:hypothetical protein